MRILALLMTPLLFFSCEKKKEEPVQPRCYYTDYDGNNNCGAGWVAVDPGVCCPSDSGFFCLSTGKCYSSCEAAEVDCGGMVILGKGDTQNHSPVCPYVNYTGAATCGAGEVTVAPGKCCPASFPYYCSTKNRCYASCDGAESVCDTVIVKGK